MMTVKFHYYVPSCQVLFLFRRECAGVMDVVWDKGGVTSIRVEDRDR